MEKMSDKDILEKFEFRNIKQSETEQAVVIEQTCFPPNEAYSEKSMIERIGAAQELFLVAIDKETGKIAGFLNGLLRMNIVLEMNFLQMLVCIIRKAEILCYWG